MEEKTYEEWLRDNKEQVEDVCCPYCFKGRCSCDCGHTHDCGNCNGKGFIKENMSYKDYLEQRDKDMQLLNSWAKA